MSNHLDDGNTADSVMIPGELKTGGRYLQFPTYQKPGHRTIANMHITLAKAAGLEMETFGQPDMNLDEASQRGPLSELTA